MHKVIHGGDIYRNKVELDFSVNTNPLSMPPRVREALCKAIDQCQYYPDIHAEKLIAKISEANGVIPEWIVCGNGSSELFLACVHAIKPKQILIPTPSFYGYEKAAGATDAILHFYEMKEDDNFQLTEGFLEELTDDIDLLILGSPNNPVGNCIDPLLLEKICICCRTHEIFILLDECFIEFTETPGMLTKAIREEYPNLIIVRAFTKIFAMPGVRLGYLFCSNPILGERIRNQLPEWNLSTFAQLAGTAALEEKEYVERTRACIRKEREYLQTELKKKSICIWPSDANFLLIQSNAALYEKLLSERILVRDCCDFRGLEKGFYRIAVKTHTEIEMLIKKVGEILGTD